ncbi:major_cap_HK97, phage major capsid protein, HK97 family [uncultured Caudovirales phage]|uniref:Major_cap_HK97, phage major capsid protein, HK97 family n=1 Tax=uncultured Caudovirales phage TaxID=2100421 RepID=A0A6J7WM65_9CAUD|nr:major_cap_HK97, phage major capsid protein, HK97 family [uncultured Caudovirales phage]
MNLEEVKGAFDGIKTEVKEAFDSAKAESNEAIESVKSEIAVLKDELDKFQAKSNSKMNNTEVKGFNGALAAEIEKNADALGRFARKESKSFGFEMDTKTTTMTESANLTGSIPREYANQVYSFPQRKVHVRTLLPIGSISQGLFTFPKETGETGTVGVQTEGSAKNFVDMSLTMTDAPARYIAGYLQISRQMLEDIPAMTSFLQARLLERYLIAEDAQLLNGTGSGVNLTGLTVAATAASGSSTVDVEQLVDACAQVASADYNATGILVNPLDWAAILKTKTASGPYSVPGSIVIDNNGQINIAGIPVYQSTAIAVDKFLVGDWNMGAQIMQHTGIGVQFSEFDADNFQKNLITVRVEARIAFPIYYGGAFVYGDFGNVA